MVMRFCGGQNILLCDGLPLPEEFQRRVAAAPWAWAGSFVHDVGRPAGIVGGCCEQAGWLMHSSAWSGGSFGEWPASA